MVYFILVILELIVASLLQQQERAAYLRYVLGVSFEVER